MNEAEHLNVINYNHRPSLPISLFFLVEATVSRRLGILGVRPKATLYVLEILAIQSDSLTLEDKAPPAKLRQHIKYPLLSSVPHFVGLLWQRFRLLCCNIL